jgi:DnaJ-class molecular chaperone
MWGGRTPCKRDAVLPVRCLGSLQAAAEAFAVLSDKDKRAVYDRYGYAGLQGMPAGGGEEGGGEGGMGGGPGIRFSSFPGGSGGFHHFSSGALGMAGGAGGVRWGAYVVGASW